MKYLVYCIIIVNLNFCYSQNLISNPSFERNKNIADDWFYVFKYCPKYISISPIYTLTNNLDANADSSGSNYDNFLAANGQNFIAINLVISHTYFSEYIVKSIPIITQKAYKLSFDIAFVDTSGFKVDNIDILFCDSTSFKRKIDCQAGKIIMDVTKSVNLKNVNNNKGWHNIEFEIFGKSNYNIMVIGNFTDKNVKKFYKKNKVKGKDVKDYKFFKVLGGNAGTYYLDNFKLEEKK